MHVHVPELLYFGLPTAAGFTAAVLLVALSRRGAGLAAVGLPLGFAFVLVLTKATVWDPDENCTQECWGTIVFAIWWFLVTVGAEVGVIVAVTFKRMRALRTPIGR